MSFHVVWSQKSCRLENSNLVTLIFNTNFQTRWNYPLERPHFRVATFPPWTKALRHSLLGHLLLCAIATKTLPLWHKLLLTKATMTFGPWFAKSKPVTYATGPLLLKPLLFSYCLLTHFATETFATFIPCDICYYDKSSFFILSSLFHLILKSNNRQEQSSGPHQDWVRHQRPVIPAGAKSTAGWPLLKCCLVVDVFVPYHHLFSEFLFLLYHILTKYFMYLHCPPEGLVGPDNCSAPRSPA